jgi:hypothetical protein
MDQAQQAKLMEALNELQVVVSKNVEVEGFLGGLLGCAVATLMAHGRTDDEIAALVAHSRVMARRVEAEMQAEKN